MVDSQVGAHLSRIAKRRAAAESERYGDPSAALAPAALAARDIDPHRGAAPQGKRLPDKRPVAASPSLGHGGGGDGGGDDAGGGNGGGRRKRAGEGVPEGRKKAAPTKVVLASISGKGGGKGAGNSSDKGIYLKTRLHGRKMYALLQLIKHGI
jgi:hypothetical protein